MALYKFRIIIIIIKYTWRGTSPLLLARRAVTFLAAERHRRLTTIYQFVSLGVGDTFTILSGVPCRAVQFPTRQRN